MTHRLFPLSVLLLGTALLSSACSVAPPMSDQEIQIKTDLAADKYMPATRQMREAIETQELFAQAAFWSNEYHLNPADLESAIKLAAAVRKLGNPGRAVEITQTTRALHPRDPYLLAEFAAALIASERSTDALDALNEGLAITPAYGRLWSLKGAALDQQERYAEARQHYDRALRITPNDPNVMANIGLSHALAGDATTAEQWLRRASSMPGASASVRQNLVLVLQLQGKNDEAQRLAGLNRSGPSLPQMRPAFNPAPIPKPAQHRGPQATMQMGSADGQSFKSASEAARAMAKRRSSQSGASTAATYEQGRATLPTQQPIQTQPQASYPQHPSLAGAPQPTPQRREPSRRRR